RAAQTAATLAALEQDTKKKKTASRSRFNRKYAIIAAATALAFVLGATVSYAVGDHVGRTTPIRIFAPPAQTHAVKTADGQFDRLTALALAGNSKAELLVGLRYLKGLGAPIDEPRAAKWIVRASVSQDPLAQYWMGEIYEHGEGVSADAAEALRWYLAAAGQGNREAMYDVGIAYAEGLGAQKNLTQSAHWFEKAAMLGLTNAQFNLAVLYERGEGVPQSLRDAYVWYAVAAANGDTESRARVDAIATQLNAPSLAAAKSAAATFHAAPLDRAANVMPNMGVRPGA
ncbi:MAG TPA: tetratricopeptide repeat protein, partial [Rhizomicrobium sp.]